MNILTKKNKEICSSYDGLISPFTLEHFIEKYWEKIPLIIRREDAGFYSSIFSIDDVDRVLDLSRPRDSSIRVVKSQVPLLPAKYQNQDGSLNLNQLYVAYADGHTVVINEIERFWQPLKLLCQSVSKTLSHHSVANMYLTPKNQKALLPHYDTHDVYVLQIHGKKHWRIYDTPVESPLLNSHQPVFKREELSNMQEITLNAGDLMYMPRGLPHEAYTTDESSLHITIGVYPAQWVDLLTKSIERIAYSNPNLRKALPIGFLQQETWTQEFADELGKTFKNLLAETVERANPLESIGLLAEEFRAKQNPVGDGHFRMLDQLDSIDLDTRVKVREGLRPSVQVTGDVCRIIFPGNVIKGPSHIAETLKYIATTATSFELNELPLISDANKVKLAARLIRGGLLKIV